MSSFDSQSAMHPLSRRIKRGYVALFLIVGFQLLFIPTLGTVLKLLLQSTATGEFAGNSLRNYILVAVVLFFVFSDLLFYMKKIRSLKKLLDIRPISCIVENFLLQEYWEDHDRRYNPYPIVRSLENGKLYVTFGSYCASGYNTVTAYAGNSLSYLSVKKDDGTPAEKGDCGNMYLIEGSEQVLRVHEEGGRVRLKKKDLPFRTADGASICEEMILFEGFVHIL